MNNGFTKRWRQRWEKGYHLDLLLWALMDWMIDFASYEDSQKYFKGRLVNLKRGQVLFVQEELADFFKAGRQRIRARLDILENIEFLSRKSTNKFTIATICNYNKYQDVNKYTQPTKQPFKVLSGSAARRKELMRRVRRSFIAPR